MRHAGKDAVALGDGGNGRDAGDADRLLLALVAAEEEEAIAQKWRPKHAPVLVAAILGLACGRAGEEVARVQCLVAEELVEAAVQVVRSGAGGEIDDSTIEAAELSGHVVGLDVELLDIVDDGKEGDLAGLRLQGGDAIEKIFVGAWAATVDARQKSSGWKRDAGGEGCELDEVASIERKRNDGRAGDGGGDVAGLRLQKWRVRGDGDDLLGLSGAQRELDAGGVAGADADVAADEPGKAGGLNGDLVEAGHELWDVELAREDATVARLTSVLCCVTVIEALAIEAPEASVTRPLRSPAI